MLSIPLYIDVYSMSVFQEGGGEEEEDGKNVEIILCISHITDQPIFV